MKYLLLFNETPANFATREQPERAEEYWGAWSAYCDSLIASGIMVSGEGLQPPATASVVRVRDGKRLVHDGPYPESKEMIGGFFVVDVPDLDAALDWAARSPAAAYASVEVRPVLPQQA
jgi:hypothetical protein